MIDKLPLPYMLVMVVSMGRSASMWAYNVTRDAIKTSGYEALPEQVPVSDQDMMAIAEQAVAHAPADTVFCLKLDSLLLNPSPHSRFIMTFRDVRDAMVSLMRFIHCDFDRALGVTEVMMKIVDHYAQYDDSICLKLRYDDIIGMPEQQARKIVGFLGLSLTDRQVKELTARWDRQSVHEKIKGVERAVQNDLAEGREVVDAIPVRNLDGTLRVFDRSTGFQSGHVSNSPGGQWRTLFSSAQQARLNGIVGDWLERHGFQI